MKDARCTLGIALSELGDIFCRGVTGRDLRQRANRAQRRLNDGEFTKGQATEQVGSDQVERERAALVERTADQVERDSGVKSGQQRSRWCGLLAGSLLRVQ